LASKKGEDFDAIQTPEHTQETTCILVIII